MAAADQNTGATEQPAVATPQYDRAQLSAGIVHIGVGNFHRAHQAYYLDCLFNEDRDHDWAIVGAGLMPYDAAMRADLARQDWMSTVVELDPDGLSARRVGAMIDYAEVSAEGLIRALTRPEIRIASLTVTEGGYFVDATSGGLDFDHPAICADIANPDAPQTVFGCLIKALGQRRASGHPPLTLMSCDNLPENGHVTRTTVLGLANEIDGDLAGWIADNVAFPNGMVDCITPATSDRERSLVRETFGIDDPRPVTCEPFRQWVLEDTFSSGRPALERVGVEFVNNVAAYELMKLRILNGGHAAIAYPAALMSYELVHEAMGATLIRAFLEKLQRSEIIPTVPAIPGVDFGAYFATIIERFSNSAVRDTIPRLCLDGSNRQPKFILPAIKDRLAVGASIDGLSLEVALWCRYCAAAANGEGSIVLEDELADTLKVHAARTAQDPTAFLEIESVFGSLAHEQAFRAAFTSAITALWRDGTEATLARYL
ncbi:MAG: mannitol dehydrogenase family protein, partial [Pseudomonadota bacterium]